MNKSIRVLRLPIAIIKKIEKHKIRQVFNLIRTNPDEFNFTEDEAKIFNNTINRYKREELINELATGTAEYQYQYLDSKYALTDLHLSTRAYNALERYNINTVSQLISYIEDIKIYNIEHLGYKSIVEVMAKAYEIVKREDLSEKIPVFHNLHIYDDLTVEQMGFSQSAINSLRNLGLYTLGRIRACYLRGELAKHFNYKTLKVIIAGFGKYFIKRPKNEFFYFKEELRENHYGKIKLNDIANLIGNTNDVIFNLDDFCRKMYGRNDLILEVDTIRLPYLLEKIKTSRLKQETENIFTERFKGHTLQFIADKFNKTRERIRQIVRDRMQQFAFFYEEAFVEEYNKFNWHPEVFKKLFNLDDFSYNVVKYLGLKKSSSPKYDFPESYYLELVDNGIVAPTEIEEFKASVPAAFKPRIKIYGNTVKKMTKRRFLEYVIANHIPKEGVHKTAIVKAANRVARDNNLDYHYDKYIDIVTNTIQGLQNIRYYDYGRIDEQKRALLKQILYDVDSVFSCTYFFKKYKTFMDEIDIRDGYELHYLLRRLFANDKEFNKRIDFRRQPMISLIGKTFGGVIIEKWRALKSPVSLDDFVGELIENYGYHHGTLINVINACLGNYISQRVLYHKEPEVTAETKAKIKTIMTDNFYELTELAAILARHGIKKEHYQYFSNLWLNDLGYKTNDINYIIKSEFDSLKEVFFSQVLPVDEYEISAKDHMMRETTLILFIETLRQEYLAFPIKNKLITARALAKKGIAIADIKNYVAALTRYLSEEVYFTYHSLLKERYYLAEPVLEKIEKMNLEPDMIINFIRNVPGIKKTTKGNLFRISNKPTTLSGFIEHLLQQHNFETAGELKAYIKDNYGIEIRKDI